MFDIEYGSHLSDARARHYRLRTVAKLNSTQLKQLCHKAEAAAKSSWDNWLRSEKEIVAKMLIKRGTSVWKIIFAMLFGLSFARTQEEAFRQAESIVDNYSEYRKNWKASDALHLSRKWLAVATNVSTIKEFELSQDEYVELLDWAARA